VMFESTPLFPDPSRYWEMVERLRITQFYTAPTAIRALMRFGSGPVEKHDLSSLRILGSVGEPINPEAWLWYHNVVGKGELANLSRAAAAAAAAFGALCCVVPRLLQLCVLRYLLSSLWKDVPAGLEKRCRSVSYNGA